MNFISLVFLLIKNDSINQKLLSLINQPLLEIVEEPVKATDDYRNLLNKQVLIQLKDLHQTYKLSFTQNITLSKVDFNEPADLVIGFEQNTLEELVNKSSDFENLIKSEKITIVGDTQLLISLVNLSSRVDLSLENILSKFIGDVPAYFVNQVGERVKNATQGLSTFVQEMQTQIFSNKSVSSDDPFRDDSQPQAKRKINPLQELVENKLPTVKNLVDHLLTTKEKSK